MQYDDQRTLIGNYLQELDYLHDIERHGHHTAPSTCLLLIGVIQNPPCSTTHPCSYNIHITFKKIYAKGSKTILEPEVIPWSALSVLIFPHMQRTAEELEQLNLMWLGKQWSGGGFCRLPLFTSLSLRPYFQI